MLVMATFASLAQLGSGLALGLTIFVEPITSREQQIRRKLEARLRVLPEDDEEAVDKRNEVLVSLLELNLSIKKALKRAGIPLSLIIVAAIVNFSILLAATVVPDAEVSDIWMWIILVICIGPVMVGFLWLLLIARLQLRLPKE